MLHKDKRFVCRYNSPHLKQCSQHAVERQKRVSNRSLVLQTIQWRASENSILTCVSCFCKTGSASQVIFQGLFLSGNDCHYKCLCFTLLLQQHFHSDINNNRFTVRVIVNLTSIHGWWIVWFPTSLFREKVEVPPYHSVLQRLQHPLDCLTSFINSQVIQLPWQQFPADTRIRYHLESLSVSGGNLAVRIKFFFPSPPCIALYSEHRILL